MRIPTKSMLRVDAILQSLLIVPMLIAYLLTFFGVNDTVFLGLMLQFFLGCLQLLSGLARAILHNSKIRQKYLGVAIAYVFLLVIAGNNVGGMNRDIFESFPVFFGIVIPSLIAIWYWGLTILQASGQFEEHTSSKSREKLHTLPEREQDDLLIEDILQRHQNRKKESL